MMFIAGAAVLVLVAAFGAGVVEVAAVVADLVTGLEVLVEVTEAGVSD